MMCHILSLEFGHGNFATAILTFKLIQDGHLKVLHLDLMVCLSGLPRKCLARMVDTAEMYLKAVKPQHHSNNNNIKPDFGLLQTPRKFNVKFILYFQKFLQKVEELFTCICCQDIVYKPVTTTCAHNICKVSAGFIFSSLAAPMAEWVRSLNFSALDHLIISPLCLV